MQGGNLDGAFGLQMFTLRREQGRLHELAPAVRHFVQQHGAAAAWRPGLALIYSELGREREARAEFEHLARHDFADLPRDGLWMACMTYLAEVCAFLGDARACCHPVPALAALCRTHGVIGNATACYGAASRYLGLLATTMERWEDAAQHFEDALAMNARMGARPWLAHTQHEYADMLLARNQPGDRDKAMALFNEALTTARELGMRALEARITARDRAATNSDTYHTAALAGLSQREVEVLRLLATRQEQPGDCRRPLHQPQHGCHTRAQHPDQDRLVPTAPKPQHTSCAAVYGLSKAVYRRSNHDGYP